MYKETSVIVLNYNNYLDTKECIESLLQITYKDIEIILVDNNSNDGSGEKLKNYFKEKITYLKSNKNIGYAAGNNIGLKYAKTHNAKYICVLNNDTLVTKDFLLNGISYLNSNKNVAFVSPVLLDYLNLKIQSVGGNINLWTGGCLTRWSNSKTIQYIGKELSEYDIDLASDYVGGACLLFKSDLIDLIGYIPENYFLFFEETEWCFKAQKYGLKCVCLHNWSIRHKGSASINKCGGLHEYMLERNRVLFEKRNTKSRFQFVIFLVILYFKTFLMIFKDKNYIRYYKYYKDGLFDRISDAYPYVYINNGEGKSSGK